MSAIERSRSVHTLAPRERYLPEVPPSGYVVGGHEALAFALHRLTTEQFTVAIDALSDPQADVAIATNATLKSMTRIAAVLRLVRSSIGDEAYRTELTILQDTTTLLSSLLEGQPELRALDQLRARFQPILQPGAFAQLREQLLHRHQLRRLQALSGGEALQRTLHRLRRARARFAAWPIDDQTDARMYGREPVEDSFSSLTQGLTRTYRRGRNQWKRSSAGELDALSKLHREVGHLGHQLEIISSSWPEVLAATSAACKQLDAVLTEEAGLSALAELIDTDATLAVEPVERALLEAITSSARAELHEVVNVLGGRLYVEPTKQFVARMAAYWGARGFDSAED